MSDQTTGDTDPTTGGRVLNFPRIGFNLNPPTTPAAPPATAPAGGSTGSATRPDWDAVTVTPDRGRRSPLDLLNALPDPGILHPALPTTPPAVTPGHLPASFRSDSPDSDMLGPRLGALSLAACLAVAVAALRGTHTVLSTWWENRQTRLAETAPLREARMKHQAAMQGIADKAAQQHAKRVPSSHEFGRKTLGNRTSSGGAGGGGRSGGGGGGSKGSSGRGSSGASTPSSSGGGRKNRPNHSSHTSFGRRGLFNGGSSGGGSGRKDKHNGGRTRADKHSNRRTPHTNSGGRGPGGGTGGGGGGKNRPGHRTNQGAGHSLNKRRRNNQPTRTNGRHNGGNGGGPDRTGLGSALARDTHKAAARRLKRRRKNNNTTPFLWGARDDARDRQGRRRPGTDRRTGPDAPRANTPGGTNRGGRDRVRLHQAAWRQAQKTARRRWKRRRTTRPTPPIWTTSRRRTTTGQGQWQWRTWRQRAQDYARRHGTRHDRFTSTRPPGPEASDHTTTGGTGQQTAGGRQSPFQHAAHASQEPPTYTVTSQHVPGSKAKRWEPDALTQGTPALTATGPAALSAAPTSNPARPGTSRPKEPIPMPSAAPDKRLAKARHQAARTGQQVIAQARHMDVQHATEITLDDALDEYGEFKDDAFTTHDQCAKLADRAIRLRSILLDFAHELAVKHNLIGPLFSSAMARLAETMDVVARTAEEMKTSSLEAAEMAEAADNDLNDAYRPYNIATADAGLSTPSAPIHNEA